MNPRAILIFAFNAKKAVLVYSSSHFRASLENATGSQETLTLA
jgi:hypothetical protein